MSGPRWYWNLPFVVLVCDDTFFVPLEGSFDVPGYVTFNLIDWTSVFTRHVSYPVLKSITGLGEEVKFDTGDACTRMLFMHNAATLHTVTNDAGEEMQTAACSFIAAPLVTWPKAPSLPASWSICCACRTCHFTFPGDVGARTKATFSSH